MSLLEDQTSKIKKHWGKIVSFGAWIVSIATSFLLPLPDWGNDSSQEAHMHFILFCTTAISGFMLILTFVVKSRKKWTAISITAFLLLVINFLTYSSMRERYTLPYDGSRVVIGNELKKGSREKMNMLDTHERDPELLKFVSGDANKIWTEESVEDNRWTLIVFLSLSYFLLSAFVISFSNLLILFTRNENKT